jgi:hypothetical protein
MVTPIAMQIKRIFTHRTDTKKNADERIVIQSKETEMIFDFRGIVLFS